MIINLREVEIFLKTGPTDMRKQINALAKIVQNDLGLNPFAKALFIFCSRDRKKLKILYWDRNGFCLWQKRLEEDRFPWPQSEEEVRKLNRRQFKMLLDGIDFFKAHQKRTYLEV